MPTRSNIFLELSRVEKEEKGKGSWKLTKTLDPRDRNTSPIIEDVLTDIPRESAEKLAEGLNRKKDKLGWGETLRYEAQTM